MAVPCSACSRNADRISGEMGISDRVPDREASELAKDTAIECVGSVSRLLRFRENRTSQ
jgi:hypothetical protein